MDVSISNTENIKTNNNDQVKPNDWPNTVVMVPPTYFKVIDSKNPYMDLQNAVNSKLAKTQWDSLQQWFKNNNLGVDIILPTIDCEDMVFSANQMFAGPGKKAFVSQMKHPSRQNEVPAFVEYLKREEFNIKISNVLFEGGGDAIWHPSKPIIYGGYGFRTDPKVYPKLSKFFGCDVITLKLVSEKFYHLDTCFFPIDVNTLLYCPAAFDTDSLSKIKTKFKNLIEVSEQDAETTLVCNGVSVQNPISGKLSILLPQGSTHTTTQLKRLGYTFSEINLQEFQKSGGSAYCLKNFLWK